MKGVTIAASKCERIRILRSILPQSFVNFFIEFIAEWISYVKLEKSAELEIQSCFNCHIEFHYLKNKENL